MIAANCLDQAFKGSNALADPTQLLVTDLEMRRLCRALNYAEWALDTPRSL